MSGIVWLRLCRAVFSPTSDRCVRRRAADSLTPPGANGEGNGRSLAGIRWLVDLAAALGVLPPAIVAFAVGLLTLSRRPLGLRVRRPVWIVLLSRRFVGHGFLRPGFVAEFAPDANR